MKEKFDPDWRRHLTRRDFFVPVAIGLILMALAGWFIYHLNADIK